MCSVLNGLVLLNVVLATWFLNFLLLTMLFMCIVQYWLTKSSGVVKVR